jgi:hypothetical protein
MYYHFQYCTMYVLSFPVLHEVCIIISCTTRCMYCHFQYYMKYVLSFPVLHEDWKWEYIPHVVLEMKIHTSCITGNDNTYLMQYWKWQCKPHVVQEMKIHTSCSTGNVCIIISSTTWGMYYHFQYYMRYVLSFPVLHEVCIIISSTTWGMYYHLPHAVLEMTMQTSCSTGNENTYLM